MIELTGLKKVRETRKGLDATKFAHTARNEIYSAALKFAEEQSKSDLRAIEAELIEIRRFVGRPASILDEKIAFLIYAIHSALQEGDEK